MDNKLRETIQNFLVDWDNTSMDEGFGLVDYDLWMETAVSLLQQCVVDVPQDEITIARNVMVQDKDVLSRLAKENN